MHEQQNSIHLFWIRANSDEIDLKSEKGSTESKKKKTERTSSKNTSDAKEEYDFVGNGLREEVKKKYKKSVHSFLVWWTDSYFWKKKK